jgi:hypothetical protein
MLTCPAGRFRTDKSVLVEAQRKIHGQDAIVKITYTDGTTETVPASYSTQAGAGTCMQLLVARK